MNLTSSKPSDATSYKDSAFGIISRSKLLKFELRGTKKGLSFIYTTIAKNSRIDLNPQLICKLHKISFGWIFPKWAGNFRRIQVTISGKEAPSSYKIPELMLNLCSDLKERLKHLPNRRSDSFITEVIKLISWFQHQFVLIHPFQDYNGRTGRMLTIFLLLKLGLPAAEIRVENVYDRKRYLIALQKADKGDFVELENIIGQAVTEELEQYTLSKSK